MKKPAANSAFVPPLTLLMLAPAAVQANPSGADLLTPEQRAGNLGLKKSDFLTPRTDQAPSGQDALQGVQQEFQQELATLRGRVDALETRTAELEANQFSTTTKLQGEVIFGLPGASGSVADDPAIGDRTRLNFDTSFTGQDRLRTRINTSIGTTSNANEEIGPSKESTSFFSLGIEGAYAFPIGERGTASIGLDAGIYHFNDRIPTQVDDDRTLTNFGLTFGADIDINESLRLITDNVFRYDGIGSFGRTLRQGVLNDELLYFNSETYLQYPVGGPAQGSTGFRYRIFDESGGPDYDSHDHSIVQEFAFPDLFREGSTGGIVRGVTPFVFGAYGERLYDNPFIDFDSEYYQLGLGVRGHLLCGIMYALAISHEWRDYDDPFFGEENNPQLDLFLSGSPFENLFMVLYFNYGIQHLYSNFSGPSNFIDPLGWQLLFRILYSFGDYGNLGLAVQRTSLEGQIFNAPVDPEFDRRSVEVFYEFPVNQNITITPSVIIGNIDGGNQDDDIIVGTLRTTFAF